MAAMPNDSFLPGTTVQFAWDNTSVSALKTCPRMYQYSIVEGWAPKRQSVHLAFGQFYHAALETYDHLKFDGASHEDAQIGALKRAMSDTWDEALQHPWSSDDQYKNRLTLVRTVVWYLEQFRDDTLETIRLRDGKPAVELSFRLETDYRTSNGEPFLYCGHIDRVAKLNDQTFVVDRKTTKHTLDERFFASFSPNSQFAGYLFASKVLLPEQPEGVIVDGAQIAVTFSRFGRQIIPISEYQLDEWYQGLGYWFKLAEGYAARNFWPMNESACGNFGGCPFRDVCSKGTAQSKQLWLEASFTKRTWNPLEVRGDI
jgi:hypothetical protein